MEDPQNGRFVVEHPIKMDDLEVSTILGNLHVGKTNIKPSPGHHHFYRWYVYRSLSWMVFDILLPTLILL